MVFFFFSSRRRHTRCALVTGVQTCALPISLRGRGGRDRLSPFKQDRRRRTPALLREIRAAISLPPCGSSPWAKTACGLGERERLEPRCRASGRRIITAPIAKIRFCDYTGTTFSEGNPNGCFRHLCPRQDRQYNEGTRHRSAGRDGPFDPIGRASCRERVCQYG